MIKSLFDEDETTEKKEEKSPEASGEQEESSAADQIKADPEEAVKTPEIRTEEKVETVEEIETIEEIKTAIEIFDEPPAEAIKTETEPPRSEPVKPFEIDHPIGQPVAERIDEPDKETKIEESAETSRMSELEKKLRELEEELRIEKERELEASLRQKEKAIEESKARTEAEIRQVQPVEGGETVVTQGQEESKVSENAEQAQVSPKDYIPVSKLESIRNSGMAWSAAIALFGAIVIMMIIGWFVDLILPTSPWGIVIGIILGAIIGFVQFFRITSNIVNPKPNDFEKVSLRSNLPVPEEKTRDEAEKPEVLAEEKPVENELKAKDRIGQLPEEEKVEQKPEFSEKEFVETSENKADDLLEVPEKPFHE